MRNIMIYLQYDGTNFSGWQRQGNTDNTIETKISQVITKMVDKNPENTSERIEIHGSGRTDAGVHAEKQVANFHIETALTDMDIKDYLNNYLPDKIRVTFAITVPDRFHSRLNATSKTYKYLIDNNDYCNVWKRQCALYHPEKLDLDKMKKSAAVFAGKMDYAAFTDLKSGKKSTVREIFNIEVEEKDGFISLEFKGNGFLYHMVRLITGAIIMAGEGKLSVDEIESMLERKERVKELYLAPAKGLTLLDVGY